MRDLDEIEALIDNMTDEQLAESFQRAGLEFYKNIKERIFSPPEEETGMRDPNFEGSIFQEMGLDAELCPWCNAHLSNGICLRGCHLPHGTMRRMDQELGAIKRKLEQEESDD